MPLFLFTTLVKDSRESGWHFTQYSVLLVELSNGFAALVTLQRLLIAYCGCRAALVGTDRTFDQKSNSFQAAGQAVNSEAATRRVRAHKEHMDTATGKSEGIQKVRTWNHAPARGSITRDVVEAVYGRQPDMQASAICPATWRLENNGEHLPA